MKICSDCGIAKPEGDYYVRKTGRLYSRCKSCHYVRCRANLKKDPERIRARERARYHAGLKDKKRWEKILKKYGLTRSGYERLLASQDGVCAICRVAFPDSYSSADWKAPSVDHCHETGLVRGILHRRCNLALEFLLSDEERSRAVAYLERGGFTAAGVSDTAK